MNRIMTKCLGLGLVMVSSPVLAGVVEAASSEVSEQELSVSLGACTVKQSEAVVCSAGGAPSTNTAPEPYGNAAGLAMQRAVDTRCCSRRSGRVFAFGLPKRHGWYRRRRPRTFL